MTKLEELIAKLSELFELDKADLDFGIHRIIKSKHKQVREYLETRLPQQVEKHLGELAAGESASQLKELQQEIASSLGADAINEAGEINESYANTPLGEKYQLVRESSSGAQSSGKVENEVYSHLLEFFSRYYEDADFMSLRRRTAGRESYAIPYNGEEVVLHWANKDQYYIKSSEDLKDYTFTVPLDSKADGKKGRIQFRLTKMDAVQNNNKASRVFQLDEGNEITATEDGLVIPFHFAEGKKRAKAAEAEWEDSILGALPKKWLERLGKEDSTYTGKGERNVLQKHLRNYTKKNTSDYFIHKDLGGFLRRELDFYVKNEVMFLDDIENRPANYLESELRKIKAIRAVAHDLIDFMKQFEDFQKKLWLKKKFVVQTNWCISLDRIPEAFYLEIAANDGQRKEWLDLFSIDKIEADLTTEGYTDPLGVDFLKANRNLILSSRHFDGDFTRKLLQLHDDIETNTAGLLVRGDNSDAMHLLKRKHQGTVKCIYNDPPYNTGGDSFCYKDRYQHSSWSAMMSSRLSQMRDLLSMDGVIFVSTDGHEANSAPLLLSELFGEENRLETLVWKKSYGGGAKAKHVVNLHEYIWSFAKSLEELENLELRPDQEVIDRYYRHSDEKVEERGPFRLQPLATNSMDERPNLRYAIPHGGGEVWPEKQWQWGKERAFKALENNELVFTPSDDGSFSVNYKQYLRKEDGTVRGAKLYSIVDKIYTQHGTNELSNLLGSKANYKFPKPSTLIEKLCEAATSRTSEIWDLFAGSGPTAQAVFALNRFDKGRRKFVLVECSEYFETDLLPRVKKTAYASTWRDLRVDSDDSLSVVIKELQLESYEDTLNNLTLDDQSPDLLGQPPELQDEYLLRYCLDTETSGSLLDCEQFKDPFNYQLKIYDRESGEAKPTKVDLPETFNYLLGLKVRTMQMKEETLVIEGENPAGETVLVIWRNVDELDNKKLDKFVSKTLRINTADTEYAAIYINGDTTLNDPHKKILLTEQVFHDLMFDVEDV